jgi:hypothetical protein
MDTFFQTAALQILKSSALRTSPLQRCASPLRCSAKKHKRLNYRCSAALQR